MEEYEVSTDSSAGPLELLAVATVDGERVSMVRGEVHDNGVFYLGELNTVPSHRCRGIASRLITHIIAERGFRTVEVTPITPESEALFEKLALQIPDVEFEIV